MDQLILSLLKGNGRVILPGLGALIVKQKEPFTVIFNEFLQYNDGAFVSAVEKELNVDREEAASKVKALVDGFVAQLDKGGQLVLNGIGTLEKSRTGKISLAAPGEKKTGETHVNIGSPDFKSPEVEFDEKDEEKTDNRSPEIARPAETGVSSAIQVGAANTPNTQAPKPVVEKNESTNSRPEIKESRSEAVLQPLNGLNANNNNRSTKSVVIWIILIVVVNGLLITGFIYIDQIKAFLHENKVGNNTEESIVNEPTEIELANDSASSIIAPMVEGPLDDDNQQAAIFGGKKYYVVAGVFRDEQNADKLVSDLKAKGYNAEKFGKLGSLFAVSYDVFPTQEEAGKYLNKVRAEYDSDAWIKLID